MRDPIRYAYSQQKCLAKKRGLSWDLSFDDWLDIWQQSGQFNNRGRKSGQYCMSRYNDTGPYAKHNVFIQTHIQNSKDANIGHSRNKGITLTRHQCPYCNKSGDMGNLQRWHFNNCKQKSPN